MENFLSFSLNLKLSSAKAFSLEESKIIPLSLTSGESNLSPQMYVRKVVIGLERKQGSTLLFLAARQSGLLLPDAAGPDQMFTGPDQLFVSEVRKCIITWFSLADIKQFQSHFT